MKSLQESLFDKDLAEKKLTINGVAVDEDMWAKCTRFFESSKTQKMIKDRFEDEHRLLYKGKDCLVYVYKGNWSRDIQWMYIFSPETTFMQYMSIKHNYPERIDIDHLYKYAVLYGIDYIGFSKKVGGGSWSGLQGAGRLFPEKEGIGENKLVRCYLPETISSKAKQIIKNYE